MKTDPAGFRHGLRVRVGGVRGVLLRCRKRDDSADYWKVRTQETPARWLWPDRIVVDGAGDVQQPACLDCRLPFIGSTGDLLCQRCQAEATGAATRYDDRPREQWNERRRRR